MKANYIMNSHIQGDLSNYFLDKNLNLYKKNAFTRMYVAISNIFSNTFRKENVINALNNLDLTGLDENTKNRWKNSKERFICGLENRIVFDEDQTSSEIKFDPSVSASRLETGDHFLDGKWDVVSSDPSDFFDSYSKNGLLNKASAVLQRKPVTVYKVSSGLDTDL